MSLSELIAQLDSAESGSRELDGRILCVVCGVEFLQWDGAGVCYRDGHISHAADYEVPRYTTSLDAALTLVPDGWGTDVNMSPPAHNCEQSAVLVRGEPPFFDDEEIEAHAATAVLALCIAALKARSAR